MLKLEVGKTYTTRDGHTATVVAELLNQIPGTARVFLGYVDTPVTTPMMWDATGHWFTSSAPKYEYSITGEAQEGKTLFDKINVNSTDVSRARDLSRAYNAANTSYIQDKIIKLVGETFPNTIGSDKIKAKKLMEYLNA